MQLSVVVREVQIPLLASLLLGGCAAKLVQVLRVRSIDAALGPTALFPVHLRRAVAMVMCGCEFALGIGLILTSGRIGRGALTNGVRLRHRAAVPRRHLRADRAADHQAGCRLRLLR